MKYLRRFMWFLASKALILTICISILVCAFYMCMNSANIFIIVSDGMEKRVEVVLTREDSKELNNYFHADFLNVDPALQTAFTTSSPYVNYNITGFDHEVTVESLWAWPWDTYATATVVERVPSITGSVLSNKKNEASPDIPSWQGGRYTITLVKVSGKWKIIGMQQTAVLIDTTPSPEPTAAN